MSFFELYPLKLKPSLHVKVWGGQRLSALLDKHLPTDEPYGESWELHDSAIVSNGPLSSKSLGELARVYGQDLIGRAMDSGHGFPLLAKFIDAEQWLSIQVHPNDAQARELEGEPRGKTEAWVILHADPGAQLVIGISPGTSRESMAEATRSDRLEDFLLFANVEIDDVLYIHANTIHALGPGLLIYEIQQSSDTTYRLYDWGRLGLDGAPRPLHIDKGLRVADLDSLPKVERPTRDLIIDGEYFCTWRHQLRDQRLSVATENRFQALTCIDGAIRVAAESNHVIDLTKGETGLIPASIEVFTVAGSGTVLRSHEKTPHPVAG